MTHINDNPSSVDVSLQQALIHFRHGQLAEAELLALNVIRTDPNNGNASYLLGMIALRQGDHKVAEQRLASAINNSPDNSVYHYNHGVALSIIGRHNAALEAFEKATRLDPGFVDAHINRAMMLATLGKRKDSLDAIGHALRLNPQYEKAHNMHGLVLRSMGQLEEALAACENAIQINPQYAEAHNNHCIILTELGHHEMALAACELAIQISPQYAEAHSNRGAVLTKLGRLEEALAAYGRAINLNPKLADAHHNRGLILIDLNRAEEALVSCERAVQLEPQHADAHCSRGLALQRLGRLEDALAAFEQTIQINPKHAKAHNNHALLLLLKGNYSHGWEEYEWRRYVRDFPSPPRSFQPPEWNGESLEGKTLLIYAEQGIGDEIMFASCLADVISTAQQCIIECETRLAPLFSRSFPEAIVQGVRKDAKAEWMQHYESIDYQIPIGSLPLYTRKNIHDFPLHSGYLVAKNVEADEWRKRCSVFGKGLKVGISWIGGKNSNTCRMRSVPLADWVNLLRVEDVHFINLQYGDTREDISSLQCNKGIRVNVFDEIDPLTDMDSFAGLVSSLDLVISVDNSTVHLAGSLGKPVWVLLPFVPNWRWLLNTNSSPWYPEICLFRQQHYGNWGSVFVGLEKALRELAGR